MQCDILDRIRQIYDELNRKPRTFASCSAEIFERFHDRIQTVAVFIGNCMDCEQQRNDIATKTIILKMMADAIVQSSASQLDETGRKLLNICIH